MQGGGDRNAPALCPPWMRRPPIPIPISARYPLPMLSCCLLHPFSPALLRTSPIALPLMAAWGLAPIVAAAPCPHGECISYHYIRFGGLPPSSPPPPAPIGASIHSLYPLLGVLPPSSPPPPAPSFLCIPLGIGRKPQRTSWPCGGGCVVSGVWCRVLVCHDSARQRAQAPADSVTVWRWVCGVGCEWSGVRLP